MSGRTIDRLSAPTLLRCEDLVDPIGVDVRAPRLSWQLDWRHRNARPSAWRLQAATNESVLLSGAPDLWDSGWRTGEQEAHSAVYSGTTLRPCQICHWRVRVRDASGKAGAWSAPAVWATGLLGGPWPSGWFGAQHATHGPEVETWISATTDDPPTAALLRALAPPARFRFRFSLKTPGALLFACALGAQRLWLNGHLLDTAVLDPVQGEYDRIIRYRAYRAESLLRIGANVLACELAGGWFHQPVVWAGEMDYGPPQWSAWIADACGQPVTAIGSTIRSAPSATLRANLYAGEAYDARLEETWMDPRFDDAAWPTATSFEPPAASMIAQEIPPIREVASFHPKSVTTRQDGSILLDMGENIAGVLRLRVEAPAGTILAMESAEQHDSSGNLIRQNIGYDATHVAQSNLYVCSGKGKETWQPAWCYHGFQYASIRGWPGEARPEQFDAVVLRNAVDSTGNFHCSDELLNKLHALARRSMEGNLHGVIEDCPHREKCGWLGDTLASYRAWWLNYDMAAVFRKIVSDIQVATGDDDVPPGIVGGKRKCGQWLDFAAATVVIPHVIFHQTGDARLLESHFTFMRRFADAAFTATMARLAAGPPVFQSNDWRDMGLGDWCDIAGEPSGNGEGFPQCSDPIAFASLRVLESLQRLTAICGILDRTELASRYETAANTLADRLNTLYYDEDHLTYGSQAMDAFALALGISPDSSTLASALHARLEINGWHHTVGCFGHAYLTPMLAAHGHAGAALKTLRAEGYPGFRDIIERGATTLWERQGRRGPGGDLPSSSLNHHFHAGYDAFLFYFVAGLRPAWGSVGWDRIQLALPLIDELEEAKAEIRTPKGCASSHWKRWHGTIDWRVRIPAGSEAEIEFPHAQLPGIYESERLLYEAPGVTGIEKKSGRITACLGGGEYHFHWPQNVPPGKLPSRAGTRRARKSALRAESARSSGNSYDIPQLHNIS